MSESPAGNRFVAGYNQFVKLVRHGKAKKVYLASDADTFFAKAVRNELAGKTAVGFDDGFTAEKLAAMAGVEVPTAVLTVAE